MVATVTAGFIESRHARALSAGKVSRLREGPHISFTLARFVLLDHNPIEADIEVKMGHYLKPNFRYMQRRLLLPRLLLSIKFKTL